MELHFAKGQRNFALLRACTFILLSSSFIIIKQSQWPTESFQVFEFWIHRLRDRLNYQSIKIMIIRGQRNSFQISKFWVRATRKIYPEQLIQDQLFFDHKIKKILITVQRTISNIWMSSLAMRPESQLNFCSIIESRLLMSRELFSRFQNSKFPGYVSREWRPDTAEV